MSENKTLETEADFHMNSFNALQGVWPGSHPLRPIMDMLAHIGYVLCDILQKLEKEGDV